MKILNLNNNFLRNLCNLLPKNLRFTSTCINVEQGKVLGQQELLPNGKVFYSFKGIPYAIPPVGTMRFKEPQPLEKFKNDILNCKNYGSIALQTDSSTKQIIGSEDCLYLNVYTPKLRMDDELLPVMVWIHGGAFLTGNGNKFHPLYLLQENVIVVTINYRLGVLGFLSLPDDNIEGNAGLKDQLLALKWVHDNIKQFNGDPCNITLFGQSAGSAAIHLHLISENSKKYFHKAILQSGNFNMSWVMQSSNGSCCKAQQLADLLGYKSSGGKLLEFMQNTKAELLVQHQLDVLSGEERRREFPITFKPMIEENESSTSIITKSPLQILKTPKQIEVPIMMGNTSNEGIMMLVNAIKKLDVIDKDLARLIPRSVRVQSDENILGIVKRIRQVYFNGDRITMKNVDQLCELLCDYHFGIATHRTVEIHAKYQQSCPLYYYQFSYDGCWNMYKKWFQFEKFQGACHGDELFYIFRMANAIIPESFDADSKDAKMLKLMCKMWTNFAKYGNPTPPLPTDNETLPFKWDPVKNVTSSSDEFNLDYLEIDENTRMAKNPDKRRMDFWRQIYHEQNNGFLENLDPPNWNKSNQQQQQSTIV